MLELKYTAFSRDCLSEMTTGLLMYTRGDSFPAKKFKFAQTTVSSGIRLSREQNKAGYATKPFLFNQTQTEVSALLQLEETKT